MLIIGIFAYLILSFVSIRNTIVLMDETINGNWAQVENQLQRRYDLIPNLVNTVKGVAKHEKDVFTQIANARSKLAGAQTPKQTLAASNMMESALSRLLVIVERYPTLKANQSFNRLMDELSGTENRLSVERRRYNESIKSYNTAIRLFPKSFVASLSGFEKKDYAEIENAARKNVTINFNE